MNTKNKSSDKAHSEPLQKTGVSRSSYKKGDLVKFNIIYDESNDATTKFDVEPQNNWFDIEVCIHETYGEIVKKNTIEEINSDGNKTGKFYKIENGFIRKEFDKLNYYKKIYGLKANYFLEDSDFKTLKDFKKIQKVNFIPLKGKYKKGYCIANPPNNTTVVRVWFKEKIGYTNPTKCYFKDGLWYDENSNKQIFTIDEFSKWEILVNRVYINGKVFLEDNGI